MSTIVISMPTETPLPLPTSTPTLAPGFVNYDIGKEVPTDAVATIKEGVAIVQAYLESELGGDISPYYRRFLRIRVVAEGQGTGIACCNASIFIDVKHPGWALRNPPQGLTLATYHRHIVAHEYAHAWQSSIGACISRLNIWLNEGMAEYIGFNAIIKAGLVDTEGVKAIERRQMNQIPRSTTLKVFANSPSRNYSIYYLAVDQLVSKSTIGPLSLRRLCEKLGPGQSLQTAFMDTFGISLDDFYDQFEQSR